MEIDVYKKQIQEFNEWQKENQNTSDKATTPFFKEAMDNSMRLAVSYAENVNSVLELIETTTNDISKSNMHDSLSISLTRLKEEMTVFDNMRDDHAICSETAPGWKDIINNHPDVEISEIAQDMDYYEDMLITRAKQHENSYMAVNSSINEADRLNFKGQLSPKQLIEALNKSTGLNMSTKDVENLFKTPIDESISSTNLEEILKDYRKTVEDLQKEVELLREAVMYKSAQTRKACITAPKKLIKDITINFAGLCRDNFIKMSRIYTNLMQNASEKNVEIKGKVDSCAKDIDKSLKDLDKGLLNAEKHMGNKILNVNTAFANAKTSLERAFKPIKQAILKIEVSVLSDLAREQKRCVERNYKRYAKYEKIDEAVFNAKETILKQLNSLNSYTTYTPRPYMSDAYKEAIKYMYADAKDVEHNLDKCIQYQSTMTKEFIKSGLFRIEEDAKMFLDKTVGELLRSVKSESCVLAVDGFNFIESKLQAKSTHYSEKAVDYAGKRQDILDKVEDINDQLKDDIEITD